MSKKDVSFTDVISLWVTNIILTYDVVSRQDGAVKSEGVVEDLTGGPLFLPLFKYFEECGGLYKLCFGPKVFMVVSDPNVVKHMMKDSVFSFDKGVLSEILEPFMGQGLIPAPFEVWRQRRRAVVPGFHQAWLNNMCTMFGTMTLRLVDKLDKVADTDEVVDMEENWNSCSLDIIGKAVFNYDFKSVEKVSPVVEAALGALREAEHRSTFYFPYWKIPGLGAEWPIPPLVPRQLKFQNDMKLLRGVLDEVILNVIEDKDETDMDALMAKDYSKINDPSLLRFLVDVRGAGHTPRADAALQAIAGERESERERKRERGERERERERERDLALLPAAALPRAHTKGTRCTPSDRMPTYDDIQALEQVRLVVTETLRLYPEPPILIRRALEEDLMPKANNPDSSQVIKGTDFFISVWNIHRSPALWEDPLIFDPDRWRKPTPQAHPPLVRHLGLQSRGCAVWQCLTVCGPRKCLGDQFALMESVVMLAVVFRRFEFKLEGTHDPLDAVTSDIGMTFGATIHSANGLNVKVKRRKFD
ncbi:cytochrome P450 [Baffinella frigidus]|nr:cytochrome P450 [Cryptophyta sp. CCMP2293]